MSKQPRTPDSPPERITAFSDLINEEVVRRFKAEAPTDPTVDERILGQPGFYWRFERANEDARDEMRKAYLLIEGVCAEHGIEVPRVSQEDNRFLLCDPHMLKQAGGLRIDHYRYLMNDQLQQMPPELRDFLDPTGPGFDPDFGQHGWEAWEVYASFQRVFDAKQLEFQLIHP